MFNVAPRPRFPSELREHVGELRLRQVLEQVACEDKVDGAIGEKLELSHRPHACSHTALHVLGQLRPDVHCRAGSAADVVDEAGVSGTELEDMKFRPDQTLKIAGAERGPEHFAAGVRAEACPMIVSVGHALGHPDTIPRIIRMPTAKARRLLALPPLLDPTRL